MSNETKHVLPKGYSFLSDILSNEEVVAKLNDPGSSYSTADLITVTLQDELYTQKPELVSDVLEGVTLHATTRRGRYIEPLEEEQLAELQALTRIWRAVTRGALNADERRRVDSIFGGLNPAETPVIDITPTRRDAVLWLADQIDMSNEVSHNLPQLPSPGK